MSHMLKNAALLLVFASATLGLLATEAESFVVPRTRKTGPTLSGPEAKRQVFQKYGWTLPAALQDIHRPLFHDGNQTASADGKQNGKVSTVPTQYYSEYLSQVSIGGQLLNLDFDTGSADLWMFSPYLPKNETAGHAIYNPSKSSTFVNASNEYWSITYGDGSGASGVVGFDRVQIGGATVTRQAVEMATSISAQFAHDADSDGLLGLAFSSINMVQPNRQKTWFDNIRQKLAQPLFVADLNEDGSGFYQFGKIDSTRYTGNLTSVPVDSSSGYWQFESSSVQIRGTTVYNIQNSPAIADTGTTLIIVDENIATNYYSNVANAEFSNDYGGWIYPCSQAPYVPSFGVDLGNTQVYLEIPTTLLTYGAVDSESCYGGIQDNGGNPLQIYGDLFFRSGFVVFKDYRHLNGSDGFVGLQVGLKA